MPDAAGRAAPARAAPARASAGRCDLVVRGGTVIDAAGRTLESCDVGIAGGRISQVGGSLLGRAEVDARGAYVLPGGVDMHVHLSVPDEPEAGEPSWCDDFASGSAAAIAGGVTTIGNMTFPAAGDSLAQALGRDLARASASAAVDYVLHPVMLDPAAQRAGELAGLAAAGHTSLKLFMVAEEFEAHADAMVGAVAEAGRCGMLTLIHCEDGALVRQAGERLLAAGRGGLGDWAESRPVAAEEAAVARAAAICELTGAPVHVVHLSSARALDAARRARARGLPLSVEARPLYLHLTSAVLAGPDGGKYVGAPPLREAADVDALWAGLAGGSVDTLGSDHAPWTLAAKTDPGLDVSTARQGVADLETMLPMLFSAGVLTGRISLARFAELTAAGPARLFGLYPRKGAIAVGADADLLVLDPAVRRVVDGASMRSRAGYSVYDGFEVTGWPRYTISRGELVLADGEVLGEPGRGRWLRRGPAGLGRAGLGRGGARESESR